jgi:hypothetical protein
MPNALSYKAHVIGHQESKEETSHTLHMNVKHINRKTRRKKEARYATLLRTSQ